MTAVPFAAVRAARELIERYTIAAEADAGFDGGEFSGPASDRALHDAMERLADRCGVNIDELWYAADPGDDFDIFAADPCTECGVVHHGHHCGDVS